MPDTKLNTRDLVDHYNNMNKKLSLAFFLDDLQENGLDKTVKEALQEMIEYAEEDKDD